MVVNIGKKDLPNYVKLKFSYCEMRQPLRYEGAEKEEQQYFS